MAFEKTHGLSVLLGSPKKIMEEGSEFASRIMLKADKDHVAAYKYSLAQLISDPTLDLSVDEIEFLAVLKTKVLRWFEYELATPIEKLVESGSSMPEHIRHTYEFYMNYIRKSRKKAKEDPGLAELRELLADGVKVKKEFEIRSEPPPIDITPHLEDDNDD